MVTVTNDDISRWNYAAEKAHRHNNKGTLDAIRLIADTSALEDGTVPNQFAVWDNTEGMYVGKTIAEVKTLLKIGLNGTTVERVAYGLTLTTADKGVEWWDTDYTTKFFWTGTTWI